MTTYEEQNDKCLIVGQPLRSVWPSNSLIPISSDLQLLWLCSSPNVLGSESAPLHNPDSPWFAQYWQSIHSSTHQPPIQISLQPNPANRAKCADPKYMLPTFQDWLFSWICTVIIALQQYYFCKTLEKVEHPIVVFQLSFCSECSLWLFYMQSFILMY